MADVFVSHVEEDFQIALQFTQVLESAGYTMWYYERDGLPGVSYLVQTGQEIDRCRAVLLLISTHSLGSHQITKEVVRAHEAAKPFMPVLVDVSHVEFQNRQPEWREAIGGSASISLAGRDVPSVALTVKRGLIALGIRPMRQQVEEQCLRLGVMVAAGLLAEARKEDGTNQQLPSVTDFATDLAKQLASTKPSFEAAKDFQQLIRHLERFFAPAELTTERMHYEIGHALGNLKIVGQHANIVQMVLNYVFDACRDDFQPPLDGLPLDAKLTKLLKCLHEVRQAGAISPQALDRIRAEVDKLWEAYFKTGITNG